MKTSRIYAHLSKDEETAVKVGKRHGKPVVLKVRVRQMWKDGYVFFRSRNGVWLTDGAPVGYFERM